VRGVKRERGSHSSLNPERRKTLYRYISEAKGALGGPRGGAHDRRFKRTVRESSNLDYATKEWGWGRSFTTKGGSVVKKGSYGTPGGEKANLGSIRVGGGGLTTVNDISKTD